MGFKSRSSSGSKTRPTDVNPRSFIAGLVDERRRSEAETLLELMTSITGEKPVMWGGPSIVGFGSYHYQYASGREGDWPRTGFSPRKAALTVYCVPGFDSQRDLLARLGPHKTGASCLYIRKLEDVDLEILRQMVARSIEYMADKYPQT